MRRPFAQVDVFTTEPGLGNPLAVVLDGTGLDTQAMQRFASWTNLSEAVLAVKPGDVSLDLGIVGLYPPGGEIALEVRALYPQHGYVVEDPVTGSLNASAAGWLLSTGRLTAPYTASQGAVLGRAGRVRITQDADGTVWTGGRSVTVIEGTVDL